MRKSWRIYVDKGYRGHDPSLKLHTYKSGQKRVSPAIKSEMKRRSAIEPVIGHIKNDGRLGRNYLKPKLANAKIEKPKNMRYTEGYVPSVGHYNLINILVCCNCGLQNSRSYITGAINT